MRGTREAGKDPLDSLQGTREARAPGRHQGGRKGLVGQPGRHQGTAREAPGLLKAILCYEEAFKGNPVLRGCDAPFAQDPEV